MSLRARLLVSHLAVAAAGIVVAFALIRILAPRIFDQTMGQGQGQGRGSGVGPLLRDALASAIDQSLLWGLLGATLVATVLGWWISGRLLASLQDLRSVANRLAAGDYTARATLAPAPEIRELDADLNTLAERLATTEERRTHLVGEISHEVRTPLTVIDGYVEGMIDGVFEVTPERLAAISDEVAKLRRLAEDFSALSVMDEGRSALQFAPARLDLIVHEVVDRLGPQFTAVGVMVDATTEPCRADVDAQRISQVVANLLGNALRATPDGGAVVVTLTPPGGAAAAGSTDGMCVLNVRDTGRGIAAADLDRVFDRFVQVPGGRGGGSGIGLTLARDIVEGHGGTLTASSPGPGQGATFTVTLPTSPHP